MTRSSRPLVGAVVSILLAGSCSALAQSPASSDPRAKPRASRSNLPDTVRRVERETGGEVLRAEPIQRDGREVYRLKVLTADGRVRVVQDDPGREGTARRLARDRTDRRTVKENEPAEIVGEPPQY